MPDLATSERTLRELEKRPSQHPQTRWIAAPRGLGRDTLPDALGSFSQLCAPKPQLLPVTSESPVRHGGSLALQRAGSAWELHVSPPFPRALHPW